MTPFENTVTILLVLILAVLLFVTWVSYQAVKKVQNISNEIANALQGTAGNMADNLGDRLRSVINALRS